MPSPPHPAAGPPPPLDDTARAALRDLPSVHELVEALHGGERNGLAEVPRSVVVTAARAVIDETRAAIVGGGAPALADTRALVRRVAEHVRRGERPPLPTVINGTGVIIHTGLGRSPWPAAAVRAAVDGPASGYAPVELDMETGARGRRADVVRGLLCRLTGAEAATVVNNNAAATLLTVTALARGGSVVVSRGELVEIGGSFRLPDVMAAGGAHLREVGTTNRTRIADYRDAVDDTTALLLKVHPSNYRIQGFTESVPIESLVALGREHGIPVVDDIGSGSMHDGSALGLPVWEPSAPESIAKGADIVLFSGDKLLGGPQAGIIVGRADLVGRIEGHPMMRAMRVDKVTLAGLAATLTLHRDVHVARAEVPTLALIAAAPERIEARARAVARALDGAAGLRSIEVRPSAAQVGGGSVPEEALESTAVVLVATDLSEDDLAQRLRAGTPAVLPRVADGAVWIDLRTVMDDQDVALTDALRASLAPGA